jgi:cell shape-determining protein MreC
VSHTLFSSFENSAKLAARNTELTNELTALQAENMGLSKELAGLSGLLGQSQNLLSPSKGILAEVVARPPVSPYDIFVISAGTRTGVSQGMLALGAGGVPVGVVQETTEDYARVLLFTAAGVDTAGWVGDANVPINLSGAGGGVYIATLARSANANVGDAVYIAGLQFAPIGTIARIDSDPSSPSVTLRIVPALNLFETKHVRLVSGGSNTILFSSASSTRP